MENVNTSEKNPVLSVKGISKHFGKRQVLTDISLDVYPGEIFGFLGPNGSGKTTTIKLILGLLRMETGAISICGHDCAKEPEAAVANVGGIIENPELYKFLTGRDNLIQYSRMYGNIDNERINEVARFVRLGERLDDKVSKYSLGMRQRLGVAQAILHRPKILILDEPTNGLDPAGIKELRELLLELAHSEGIAVFISSHLLSELDMLCDRIAIINGGKIIDTMTMEEVRRQGSGENPDVAFEIDPDTASLIPNALKNCFVACDEGHFTLVLPKEDIPDTVAALVSAGVRIYSVQILKKSLEEVFLTLTSEFDGSEGGKQL